MKVKYVLDIMGGGEKKIGHKQIICRIQVIFSQTEIRCL